MNIELNLIEEEYPVSVSGNGMTGLDTGGSCKIEVTYPNNVQKLHLKWHDTKRLFELLKKYIEKAEAINKL